MIRDRVHLADLLARAPPGCAKRSVGATEGSTPNFRDGHLVAVHGREERSAIFARIGVPAYPEGHADIPDDVLVRALKAKQHSAHSMTTQMSFNPEAVSAWIGRMRSPGVRPAVHRGCQALSSCRS